MPIDVEIVDGRTGNRACITPLGELVVGGTNHSEPYTASATVINTGYNYTTLAGTGIVPVAGKRFVITSILIGCDRNVGATSGALINIYEAESPTSITSTKDIVKDIEIVKNERQFMNLDMIVTEGKWVNIKTDDNNVRSTIWGYYVNA